MAVVALGRIVHGKGKGAEPLIFEAGDEVKGLDQPALRALKRAGAIAQVEKVVKVDAEDPTVIRDTHMVMSGNYPPHIDRPPAVGSVPVTVISVEDAKEIEDLKAQLAEKTAEADRYEQELQAARANAKTQSPTTDPTPVPPHSEDPAAEEAKS